MMNIERDGTVVQCTNTLFQHEGNWAFYKGALNGWLRLGPHTAVTFVSFEYLRAM
jgi:hypothetical protein